MKTIKIASKKEVFEKMDNNQMRNLCGGAIIRNPIERNQNEQNDSERIKRGGLDHIGVTNTPSHNLYK